MKMAVLAVQKKTGSITRPVITGIDNIIAWNIAKGFVSCGLKVAVPVYKTTAHFVDFHPCADFNPRLGEISRLECLYLDREKILAYVMKQAKELIIGKGTTKRIAF